MDYAETLRQHRRLSILRALAGAPEYTANDSMLTELVNSVGVTSTRDQVVTAIGWLAEQGLVTAEKLSSLTVAKVTTRGADVAAGRASVEGVKRPSPGT